MALTISVLVPTFRRPDDLRRCLDALHVQTRAPDVIIVVARSDDMPTLDVLDAFTPLIPALQIVHVYQPGGNHALTRGLDAVKTDIVCITDDDGAPHPDWVEKIEKAFLSDPRIGGVGGRDILPDAPQSDSELKDIVGRVQWFGRVIGNHHIGRGGMRPVHVLKNVNCAYRAEPLKRIGFSTELRGPGAAIHAELVVGLAMMREGWRLVYDPSILVRHYPARRHDIDQRNLFNAQALGNEVFNETHAVWVHFSSFQRLVYILWFLGCGTRRYPGLLCWAVELLRGDQDVSKRLKSTLGARFDAIRFTPNPVEPALHLPEPR